MSDNDSNKSDDRRTFINQITTLMMLAGLAGGYGAFAAVAVRYLFPARPPRKEWMYVARASDLQVGDTMPFTTPSGATVTVVRRAENGTPADFIALSSTCPHLGCKVHWEAHKNRFFCPCHNGVFTPDGVATEGPPAEAGQTLPEYPLRTAGNLLFMEVDLQKRTV